MSPDDFREEEERKNLDRKRRGLQLSETQDDGTELEFQGWPLCVSNLSFRSGLVPGTWPDDEQQSFSGTIR